jgi:tRNA A37 N6-isopentenylltransferase MiaA
MDVSSRMAIYWERTMEGTDTHRDDIGTFEDRRNRRRVVCGRSKTVGVYREADFKYRDIDDLLITLLEDGKINIRQYIKRQRDLMKRYKQDDIDTLPKAYTNKLGCLINRNDKKKQITHRLRKKLEVKKITEKVVIEAPV